MERSHRPPLPFENQGAGWKPAIPGAESSHRVPLLSESTSRILTLGFEGPNRVGKGTQCALLQAWLTNLGIPSLLVRGDGSRTGRGATPGDPSSRWWQQMDGWLHSAQATYHDWNMAAVRLARELLVWRDRVLPRCVAAQGAPFGVLLVDRTLLSRAMLVRAMQPGDPSPDLYPEEAQSRWRWITPETVCPDLIFALNAPREVLLSRLSPLDPKYAFRRRLIEETSKGFRDAVQFLPKGLQDRIVDVDATRPVEEVEGAIQEILTQTNKDCKSYFELLQSPHVARTCRNSTLAAVKR